MVAIVVCPVEEEPRVMELPLTVDRSVAAVAFVVATVVVFAGASNCVCGGGGGGGAIWCRCGGG